MGIVMDMGNYEIERDTLETEYGEEVMYAGWNPAVALTCLQRPIGHANEQATMPIDIAAADVGLFLRRIYACQR
jgi:hypothetical protein